MNKQTKQYVVFIEGSSTGLTSEWSQAMQAVAQEIGRQEPSAHVEYDGSSYGLDEGQDLRNFLVVTCPDEGTAQRLTGVKGVQQVQAVDYSTDFRAA